MEIDQLKNYLPKEFLEKLKKEGIEKLYPAQEEAVKRGVFEGKNLVIATPTASGKTLIATFAIIKNINLGKKIIYVVPLVALAGEKYQYYKEFLGSRLKVAISVGDLDSSDPWLKNYHLIITTTEKLDSLLRHGIDWLSEVGGVVIDEVHLINEPSRGPTLEIVVAILKKSLPQSQFLALSATITNVEEIADWLNAGVVRSNFRPIRLYEGILYDGRIIFSNRGSVFLSKGLSAEEAVAKDTVIKRKKQLLIFVANRLSSEALAERLVDIVEPSLKKKERYFLKNLSEEILRVILPPTRQCQRLARLIEKGVAFHHAGLVAKQRTLIEDNFRGGLIKVVCCTPTLALGVNLPAFRVLIRDIKRYYPGFGSVEIPVLEYKQFAGRAGRPQFDRFGEALILAKSYEDIEELTQKYILGEPEGIESKLAQERVLRIYTLALIAQGTASSLKGFLDFFSLTFFGFQYKDITFIETRLRGILSKLEEWGFIKQYQDRLSATSLGRRISYLYIDPQTAYFFIEALRMIPDLGLSDFGILQVISYTIEMQPPLRLTQKDFGVLQDTVNIHKEKILMDVPLAWDDNYEDFLRSIKLASCFLDWINELKEAELLEKFQITPGELHNKLEIADWLIYALIEIAKLLKLKEIVSYLKKLRIRLKIGVKEELLELITLSQIGRVRARRLFDAGIRDISSLKKTPLDTLTNILGKKVALKIVEQLR